MTGDVAVCLCDKSGLWVFTEWSVCQGGVGCAVGPRHHVMVYTSVCLDVAVMVILLCP